MLTAAYRELKEETNLSNVQLKYVTTVGNSYRDPRGFCITNVFICELDKIPNVVRAGDDAVDYEWFDLNDLPEMAFDHADILTEIMNNQEFYNLIM
jgi:8-oxo-dGTP diphosphatase